MVVELRTTRLIPRDYGIIDLVDQINPNLPVFFDTETTGGEGSDLRTDKPVALQFHQGEATWIIDARRLSSPARMRRAGKLLAQIFEECTIVGHNLKFDLEVLSIHFGVLPLKLWDTMLAEQVIYGLGLSDGRKKGVGFSLKALAERRGITVEKETRSSFYKMDETPAWNEPFTDEQLRYMAQDVEVLPTIYEDQRFQLTYNRELDEGRLLECFDLEMEVTPALAHVEVSGVPVDWDAWMGIINQKAREANALKEEVTLVLGEAILEARSRRQEKEREEYQAWEASRETFMNRMDVAFDELLDKRFVWITLTPSAKQVFFDLDTPDCPHTRGKFKIAIRRMWTEENTGPKKPKQDTSIPNIGSTQQLLTAFAELGIEAKDTTEDTLEDLAEEHEVVGKLLKYRKAAKFVQSFGENLRSSSSSADGRLHPDYMQIGASTNRMSCTKPNFQQIPSRSETGKALRKCVKAPPGFKILTADFGSQELCIIAELSGDENMLGVFDREEDPHCATARMMFGLDASDEVLKGNKAKGIKPLEIQPGLGARDAAKTNNYGIAYGLTAYGLAYQLNISVSAAEDLIERWYTPYPQVRSYFNDRKAQIFRGELYSETAHGWVRRYDPLPAEPRKPQYNIRTWAKADQQAAWDFYKSEKKAWDKARRRLENQLMNTPVQGTGAGVTKKALADFFFTVVLPYNERSVPVQTIAAVHDEMVALVPEAYAQEVAVKLAECMDGAMRYYLRRVNFPRSEVHIADCWSK